MGVVSGSAEELVDPVDEPIAHGMLHVFGFLVHLVPRDFQGLNQEQLDQPVSAEHPHGQFSTRRRENGSRIRRVAGELRFIKRFQHAGDGARQDRQRVG